MFGTIYGLPARLQVPQSLRVHPVFPLLRQLPWPDTVPLPDGLPRLYIGRGRTQELTGRKLAPLETRLDELSWWGFSPEEDVSYYIRQLEAFLDLVPKALLTTTSWQGLDPLIHGPYTAEALWPALLPGPAGKWTILEHERGWNWWDPAHPDRVSGLQADPYYAHCGIARTELRKWLQESAAQYLREDREHPVTSWFESRFGYSHSEALRMAPWLMHLKHQAGYLEHPAATT